MTCIKCKSGIKTLHYPLPPSWAAAAIKQNIEPCLLQQSFNNTASLLCRPLLTMMQKEVPWAACYNNILHCFSIFGESYGVPVACTNIHDCMLKCDSITHTISKSKFLLWFKLSKRDHARASNSSSITLPNLKTVFTWVSKPASNFTWWSLLCWTICFTLFCTESSGCKFDGGKCQVAAELRQPFQKRIRQRQLSVAWLCIVSLHSVYFAGFLSEY